MFARLLMFSFIVFFGQQAFAKADVQPKLPAEPQVHHEIKIGELRGISHDRLIGAPNADRVPA